MLCMVRTFLNAILVLAWLAAGTTARAAIPGDQFDPNAGYVRAALVSEFNGVVPGQTATLGVRLRHEAHWHTYWKVAGDAGLPTRLRWQMPAGYTAGPIQWPAPTLLQVGDLANYGYEGEVLLPVSVRVPASAVPGTTARFAVRADWLVCNDVCVPGGADLTLSLPVRTAGSLLPTPDATEFAATRARIPVPRALPGLKAAWDGTHIRLRLAGAGPVPDNLRFFPLEPGRIQAATGQRPAFADGGLHLDLAAATPIDPAFHTLRGVLESGNTATEIAVAIAGAPTPKAVARTTAASAYGADAAEAAQSADLTPVAAPGEAPPAPPPASPADRALLVALAGAFLGGMILNLMPCVFPVLSLKLIGLVRHRTESPSRLRAHGLAYAGGAVLTFVGLAGALLGLRAAGAQIGWGFQLQSPGMIATLAGLFFLIGLNLLGLFEFSFGTRLANGRLARTLDGDGPRASFATGALAVLVASPCTGPFMGAAVGFAATQPAATALMVFAVLGAGMAMPYLIVTFFPPLLRLLPRPGAWMARFKHIMAVPMFLTCVWLLWVLAQQVDAKGLVAMAAALAGFGLFGWALGRVQRGGRQFRWIAAVAAIAALAVPVSFAAMPPQSASALTASAAAGSDGWAGWSPRAQQQALAQGRPVFVDFTAAWCISCKANEHLVLRDARVEQALRAHHVALLRADWTRRNEAISRELARFSRSGVPMYVVYNRSGDPQLLPEILSTAVVLDALNRLQ